MSPSHYRDNDGNLEAVKLVLVSSETGHWYSGLRSNSAQVDFVGGHRDTTDCSRLEAISREITEELEPGRPRDTVIHAVQHAPSSSGIAEFNGRPYNIHYYAAILPERTLSHLRLSTEGSRELYAWGPRPPASYASSLERESLTSASQDAVTAARATQYHSEPLAPSDSSHLPPTATLRTHLSEN